MNFSGAFYDPDATVKSVDFSTTWREVDPLRLRVLERRSATLKNAVFTGALLMGVKASDTTYGSATEATFPKGWQQPAGVPKKLYDEYDYSLRCDSPDIAPP